MATGGPGKAPYDKLRTSYVDVAFLPGSGGDVSLLDAEFFKHVRARYYVATTAAPTSDLLKSLVVGKEAWTGRNPLPTPLPPLTFLEVAIQVDTASLSCALRQQRRSCPYFGELSRVVKLSPVLPTYLEHPLSPTPSSISCNSSSNSFHSQPLTSASASGAAGVKRWFLVALLAWSIAFSHDEWSGRTHRETPKYAPPLRLLFACCCRCCLVNPQTIAYLKGASRVLFCRAM